MRVVFLVGPYRAESNWELNRNIEEARTCAAHLWQNGFACICPHLNTAYFSGVTPEETFLEGYHEILKRCDCVLCLPDWRTSKGSRAEVDVALANRIPVCYSLETLIKGKYPYDPKV